MIKKVLAKGFSCGFTLTTIIFTFVPEDALKAFKIFDKLPDHANITIVRLIICAIFVAIASLFYWLYLLKRRKVLIKEKGFEIQVEYGDILEIAAGKKVINFDECFTSKIGDAPGDINKDSLCGKFLERHPEINTQAIVKAGNLQSEEISSQYNSEKRYKSGTIVPYRQYLLMAFTKLDKDGRGYMSYGDYISCLNTLWDEIDKYYGQQDVYIPVLGSGVTRLDDSSITQQDLVGVIVNSYKLCKRKIKLPNKLHIVCFKRDDFSLNKIIGID